MLNNLILFTAFDPADIVSLSTFEMLQYHINIIPNNGYAITDLAVLLGMILFRSGLFCIVEVNGGYINGILVNNMLHTVDPNIIFNILSIFLD